MDKDRKNTDGLQGQWARRVLDLINPCKTAWASVTPDEIDAVTQASSMLRNPNFWDPDKHLVKARYFTPLADNRVRCDLCPNKCVLGPGKPGTCLTRVNQNGTLYTRVYGYTAAKVGAPMDFCLPMTGYTFIRSNILDVGLVGCGLRCPYCVTGPTVQADPKDLEVHHLSPERIVQAAKDHKAAISFTINEPTNNFEFTIDTARLARKNNVKTVMVTSGWVNPDPLAELAEYIDGIWYSIKGSSDEEYRKFTGGRIRPVMENLELLAGMDKPLEIFYLIFPTTDPDFADLKNMAGWMKNTLGEETCVYLLRFTPLYRLTNLPPTPVSRMNRARAVCREAGLKYVLFYAMGTPGWFDEPLDKSVHCPYCDHLLADVVFADGEYTLVNNADGYDCSNCGRRVPGIFGQIEI